MGETEVLIEKIKTLRETQVKCEKERLRNEQDLENKYNFLLKEFTEEIKDLHRKFDREVKDIYNHIDTVVERYKTEERKEVEKLNEALSDMVLKVRGVVKEADKWKEWFYRALIGVLCTGLVVSVGFILANWAKLF